jgi:hypothetical protein
MRGGLTPQWVGASACLLPVVVLNDDRDLPHQFGKGLKVGGACSGVSAIASHTLLKVSGLVIGYLSSCAQKN